MIIPNSYFLIPNSKKANVMVHINDHYLKLKAGYLFPEIARRVDAFATAHPQADVIRLGIGDVVKGIPRPMVDAMKEAVEEMAHDDTLQGYPPDQGQDFSARGHCRARLWRARRAGTQRRDFCLRRVQVRLGRSAGNFRRRLRGRADRSGLSSVLRFQRYGRPHGSSRREWFVRWFDLHAVYGCQ